MDIKGSIEDIHKEEKKKDIYEEGHPLKIFEKENEWIQEILNKYFKPNLNQCGQKESLDALKKGIGELAGIHIHYTKKEDLLFPYLEKYEITGPPKVMWGVDDEIRDMIKGFRKLIEEPNTDEEKIKHNKEPKTGNSNGVITLPSGHFTVEELTFMLNSLPFDITFVNKGDEVNYFTEGKERIFARTRTIVGRNVSNCHPPASVHIVEGIVEDFKNGKKDHEDFWLHMKDMFVYIRYFAVRNEKNEYLGVLEVTQNIAPIMELKGEKRLVE